MSNSKRDLINFRMNRAKEAFDLASISISKKYWNSAASELYYTCYYLVSALFAKDDIKTSTHTGVKTLFGLHFVKEGKIDIKWGKLFSTLFDKRQEGDYHDFMSLTPEQIIPLYKERKRILRGD